MTSSGCWVAATLALALASAAHAVTSYSPPIRSSDGNNMNCTAQNLSSSAVMVRAEMDNGLGTVVDSGTLSIPAGESLRVAGNNTAVFGGFCRFIFDGDPAAVRGVVSREDFGGSDTRIIYVARALPEAGPALPTLLATPPLRSSDGNNLGCVVQNLSNAAVQVISQINDGLNNIVDSQTFAVPAGQVRQLAFTQSPVFGAYCTFQFQAPADQVRGFATLEDKGGSDTRVLVEATLTMSPPPPDTATPTSTATPLPTSTTTPLPPTATSTSPAGMTATATAPRPACCGDCNGDGTVNINELITAVNHALDGCPMQ
jgi:hypothetical protein